MLGWNLGNWQKSNFRSRLHFSLETSYKLPSHMHAWPSNLGIISLVRRTSKPELAANPHVDLKRPLFVSPRHRWPSSSNSAMLVTQPTDTSKIISTNFPNFNHAKSKQPLSWGWYSKQVTSAMACQGAPWALWRFNDFWRQKRTNHWYMWESLGDFHEIQEIHEIRTMHWLGGLDANLPRLAFPISNWKRNRRNFGKLRIV